MTLDDGCGFDAKRPARFCKDDPPNPLHPPCYLWVVEKGARIVIAEDEAIIRMDLSEMLEEEGYEVVGQAGDGQTAVELVESLRPDLAILDIVMPEMDGLTAAAQIGEKQLAAVLILTAFSQRDLVARATKTGAMAYLVKPFNKEDLVPAVELAMARWAETRELAGQTEDLSERLETRKLVERAKGVLMESRGLTEQDAFRLMQKTAMKERVGMKEVAEKILTNK